MGLQTGKILCIFITIIYTMLIGYKSHAQNMDPEIAKMTDELMQWTQEQYQTYGTIDQHKLDSMNQRIRDRQKEIENLNGTLAENNGNTQQEGKLIKITMVQTNAITVPSGKTWKVKRAIVQAGIGGFSVVVSSVKFKDSYSAGEQIIMPAFTPEASLLTSDQSNVTYILDIIEN